MRTMILTAGALAAALLAGATAATAKDNGFSLTFAGPNGYVQVGAPGPHHKGAHDHSYRGKTAYHGKGYGYADKKPYDLHEKRAYGYCLNPGEIRYRLRERGWWDIRPIELRPHVMIAKASRHRGRQFRIKVDRCNGQIVKAHPVGYYGYRNHYYGGRRHGYRRSYRKHY